MVLAVVATAVFWLLTLPFESFTGAEVSLHPLFTPGQIFHVLGALAGLFGYIGLYLSQKDEVGILGLSCGAWRWLGSERLLPGHYPRTTPLAYLEYQRVDGRAGRRGWSPGGGCYQPPDQAAGYLLDCQCVDEFDQPDTVPSSSGNSRMKQLPPSGWLSTVTRPPWAWATLCTIARPRPLPST